MSLAAGLLARLDRRLADEKEGLGYETGSHTLAATRAAFKESLTSTDPDGHYEHIAPEVGKFGLNLVYILQSPGAEQVRQTWRPPDQCMSKKPEDAISYVLRRHAPRPCFACQHSAVKIFHFAASA